MSPVVRRSAARVLVVAVALLAAVLAGPVLGGTPVHAAPANPVCTPGAATDDDDPDDPADDPADDVPVDPLQVVLERLTPSTVPENGRVTVVGTVRNRSTVDWSDLQVYLLTSFDPITTAAGLASAAESEAGVRIGDRITDPDLYATVPDLAPGESTGFRLSIPRSRLQISGRPGVYWLGVHVLGTAEGGRIEGADGRARTFLPLVPRRAPATELALALQVRNHVVRAPDGRLGGLPGWQAALGRDGRLGRLVGLGATADAFPLTWVLDPAVLDAARSVGEDNPPLGLDAPPPDEGDPSADADGEDDGDGDGGDGGDGDGGGEDAPSGQAGEAPSPEAGTARRWLQTFAEATADQPVLGLPYGDLDVSAAVRLGQSEIVGQALDSGADVLGGLDVPSTSVLSPPDGLMSPTALDAAGSEVPVVLAPEALAGGTISGVADACPGSVLDRFDGGRVLVTPSPHAVWGPGPGARRTALAVRQRLLADAALHALSSSADQPLVRMLPVRWDPGSAWRQARFFRGLQVSWLSGASVSGVIEEVEPVGRLEPTLDVRYPESSVDAELSYGPLATASRLIERGGQLEELLTDDTVVDDEVTRQALLTTSVWSRRRPFLATARARGTLEVVDGWLGSVTVRGPTFVTMSSETGSFQMTLVNGLDQPVTVGLRATVRDGELEVTTSEPVQLPAGGRGPVDIEATASDIGIHVVTLQPVSVDGGEVGAVSTLSIRSSRVGLILWVVMAVGSAILFLMVAYRIIQRVRQRRRTHGPLLQRGGP